VKPAATSLAVNAIVAATGGFLDGFTYVGHGRVFANGMTANMILFSASLFMRSWQEAIRFLPPIAAFLAAIWAAQALYLYSAHRGVASPYRAVLFLEIAVLTVLSLLPASTTDLLFTTSIAFAAAVQMQTFREVNGRNYCSTFTTGNLRTLAEASFFWCFRGYQREAARTVKDFATVVGAFLSGALAGGGTTKAFGNRALWVAIFLLFLVAIRIERSLTKNAPDARELSSTHRGTL
jgi:uncharacterized membrane protein YoaK (UPF0700 family)